MASRKDKARLAYELFRSKSTSGQTLTVEQIVAHTGWAESTVKTYLNKHWETFFTERERGEYQVSPDFCTYPLDVFERISSQKLSVNKDPFKPILTRKTEELITKSRESALLAVQVYNNPLMMFRTPSFIVHMIIAFTAFFHAVFEQDEITYSYMDSDVAGQSSRLWDIRECMREFWGNENPPSRQNLELFVKLRNEVEHRYAPAFDLTIAGECQALLLNYERMVTEQFSPYYSLGASVSVPLQISRTSTKARIDALRELQGADYEILRNYVHAYRFALDDDIYMHPEYSFRVFLVQSTANRERSSDLSMQFIPYESLTPEQHGELERAVTLVKTRTVPVANHGLYKPGDVVKEIQRLEPRFRIWEHTQAWKYYKVRRRGTTPVGCNTKYCQFDNAHQDYVYTEEWIELLKRAVTDEQEYLNIRNFKEVHGDQLTSANQARRQDARA